MDHHVFVFTKQVLQNMLRSRLPVSASSTIVWRKETRSKERDFRKKNEWTEKFISPRSIWQRNKRHTDSLQAEAGFPAQHSHWKLGWVTLNWDKSYGGISLNSLVCFTFKIKYFSWGGFVYYPTCSSVFLSVSFYILSQINYRYNNATPTRGGRGVPLEGGEVFEAFDWRWLAGWRWLAVAGWLKHCAALTMQVKFSSPSIRASVSREAERTEGDDESSCRDLASQLFTAEEYNVGICSVFSQCSKMT